MKKLFVTLIIWISLAIGAHAKCNARFLNPITEVCWSCIFPITIGPVKIPFGPFRPSKVVHPFPICLCPGFPPRIGFSISMWEPSRLVDVANEPGCFTNLGFTMNLGLFGLGVGSDTTTDGGANNSKYHAHYYYYPLLSIIGSVVDGLCMQIGSFDVAFLSEFDPTWMNPELSLLLNPEAVLFANPIAEAACSYDCVRSSSGVFLPDNKLFWCNGCTGGLYPLGGVSQSHGGLIMSSQAIAAKMLAKQHRIGTALDTSSAAAMCQPIPAPVWVKNQYRFQVTRPFPSLVSPFACGGTGYSTQFVDKFKEIPYVGESAGQLIWKQRSCCAL